MKEAEILLRQHDMKVTKTRIRILEVLEEADGPMDVETIYQEIKKSGKISLATVYRTVEILCDMGILLRNLNYEGTARYQYNRHKHTHQLTCTRCKKAIVIDDCPIDKVIDKLKKETGFRITGHMVEVTGICPDCLEKEKEKNQSYRPKPRLKDR